MKTMSLPIILADNKRQRGQFYTTGNPFILAPFKRWVEQHELSEMPVLEPFAGANNLIRALQEIDMAEEFASFDIDPTHSEVLYRDTIRDFPRGFDFVVTNPPWLAKNSAKRRGLAYPQTEYDDLYKHALALCLANTGHVAAIIPATFLQSGLFRERVEVVIFLHDPAMFLDTENPVCLALFSPLSKRVKIYHDNIFIGYLDELEKNLPEESFSIRLTFNHPQGALGLIAIDNTRTASIRFVHGEELAKYEVGFSSRMITRVDGEFVNLDRLITKLNHELIGFRKATKDVFLTPFKGLRKDGQYRRRMDYRLARDFIAHYAGTIS